MTVSPTSSTSMSAIYVASSSSPAARSASGPSVGSATGLSRRRGVLGWLARLPVRARLTAWSVLLLAVILTTLGSFLLLRLRADLVAEVDDGLDGQAAGG